MVNLTLFLVILGYFAYAFYDQFGTHLRKGKTRLKVALRQRTKIDSLIFIALIALIIYQTEGQIQILTLLLLTVLILLSLYSAFFRSPWLLLKDEGLFLENIFIPYAHIQNINLAPDYKLVFHLTNGKNIVAWLINQQDTDAVVAAFGGYKTTQPKR